MCVCVAALLCPFLLFYIFHTGTQGHIAADLFLFAKRFFPHSTTYHHRSASGLCPGLIGLVSLTPNILFWRGHFSCEKQQNKSGESNNSTISTTQYNYKNLCVCEPNESKWLTSSTSSTKEKEKAAITSEWIMEPLLLSKIDRIFNSLRLQNRTGLHHSTLEWAVPYFIFYLFTFLFFCWGDGWMG